MKKLLLVLAAAFAMVACQTDINEVGVVAGGEVDVTFAVGTPTRAYSDGLTATHLQYAVYEVVDSQNELSSPILSSLTETNGSINNRTATVKLQLVTGNTYAVVFWAAAPNAPYTVVFGDTLGDATMTVDYTNALSNDENRDAFFKKHVFTVKGAQTETIELRRPFAQLNIGTNDYDASANAGYIPVNSYVEVAVHNTLKLATGVVENQATRVFHYAAINKDETFPVAAEAGKPAYKYLAMNYLLVDADKETVDVVFGYSEGDAAVAKTRTVGSVPVQRNYRTNIYGQLLTSDVDINIEIKPEYDGAHELDAIHKAALNGGEITLTEDVILTTPLEVMAAMTINLNGKTINNPDGYAIENYSELTIEGNGGLNGMGAIRSHGGKVTVNGGTFTGTSNWSAGTYQHLLKAVNTEVVINGGTFDATIGGTNNAMINVSENSVVTINGGTFKNVDGVIPQFAPYMFTYEKNGKLIINGGEFYGGWRFNGETATTDIYGGNFTVSYDGQSFHANSTHVLKIYGGVFSLDNGAKLNPANHLAAGYKVAPVGNLYYVLPEVVADAAVAANVTSVTESTADVATALATDNGEATMFLWNDVAYIAKYGEVVITSSAEDATTVRGVVEYASGLTTATVAEGIEVVGNRTFRKCGELVTVALPNSLTEIGPAVFQSCSKLANITIPAGVTAIGEGAFAECVGLTSINIPNGVTRLEKDVLRNTGLTSIEIPASVNYIGTYAFRDCESLTEVKILSPEFTIENNTFTNMAAPVPTMTIYVVNNEMKAYLDSVLTAYDKSYITVVGPTMVSNIEELNAAIESGKTVVINANIEDATIKLPANLSNFTLRAAAGVVLKNSTISAADGNAYHYENLTFDGLTFDNSRIVLTGWRNGEETLENLTITNCVFNNLDDTTNTAAIHINKDASEAVKNFTFTNNVINGAVGGSKSGVYAQVTGKVVFENNVINNVAFRPYVVQVTTDDGIADSFSVKGNTFSGSSKGRAQGLGNNAEGTDAVQLIVSGNIFKDITEAQQICYWNFNAATTTADLSKNYYSIDIEANPSLIYYNASASSVEDLKAMGVYPYYTELNADGTINLNSLKQAE